MRIFLLPFSWIFGIITSFRNLLFNYNILPISTFDIPIISIGNITMGGTGKTPHVDYIMSILKRKYKVAVLSRGYKRKTKCFLYVNINSNFYEVGDESLFLKKKHEDCIIAVDKKRKNGIKKIMIDHPEVDVILLDDAFQHRWVKPGLNILLTNYQKLIYKDYLFPFGNLRESKKEIKRADLIIVSKCPKNIKTDQKYFFHQNLIINREQELFISKIIYKSWKNLFENSIFTHKKNLHIILISGIANSEILKNHLIFEGHDVKHFKFKDHYSYKSKDIKRILNYYSNNNSHKIIVTTEKDATRLNYFSKELKNIPIFTIPIEVLFTNSEKFNNKILNYVKENKRNI